MPEVDPSRRRPPDGDKPDDDALPPGEYLLAMTWFDHKQGNSGAYLRAGITVIAGPLKGRKFFTNMGVDTHKPGTHNRWQIYAEHVGCTERFNTESQPDIVKHFKGRGFKCMKNFLLYQLFHRISFQLLAWLLPKINVLPHAAIPNHIVFIRHVHPGSAVTAAQQTRK